VTAEQVIRSRYGEVYCLPVQPFKHWPVRYSIFEYFTDWTLVHGTGDTQAEAWEDAASRIDRGGER
jgi:hypothetical protein